MSLSRQNETMSWTTRKYPGNPSVAITPSSCSIWRYASGASRLVPNLRAAPLWTSSRSQLSSSWPGGTSNGGNRGATRLRSKADSAASSAAPRTTQGYRANRAAISAPDRRCAVPAGGSQPSISSRVRRARIAAVAAANGHRDGVA